MDKSSMITTILSLPKDTTMMINIVLVICVVIGLICLIIGNVLENGKFNTFGFILVLLGVLILLTYNGILFLQQSSLLPEPNHGFT